MKNKTGAIESMLLVIIIGWTTLIGTGVYLNANDIDTTRKRTDTQVVAEPTFNQGNFPLGERNPGWEE